MNNKYAHNLNIILQIVSWIIVFLHVVYICMWFVCLKNMNSFFSPKVHNYFTSNMTVLFLFCYLQCLALVVYLALNTCDTPNEY